MRRAYGEYALFFSAEITPDPKVRGSCPGKAPRLEVRTAHT